MWRETRFRGWRCGFTGFTTAWWAELQRRFATVRERKAYDATNVVVVESAELGQRMIKRVVGLPGEHIDVDADGRVQVSGHDLAEPYVLHRGGRPGTFDVPAGHLLLLGDHRVRSS